MRNPGLPMANGVKPARLRSTSAGFDASNDHSVHDYEWASVLINSSSSRNFLPISPCS